MDFPKTMAVVASGLLGQAGRMRIISENIVNADSPPTGPCSDPYRRKVPSFRTGVNRALNVQLVELRKTRTDSSDFRLKYEPGHPAADKNGNVKYPNVNPLSEMIDMREAWRPRCASPRASTRWP